MVFYLLLSAFQPTRFVLFLILSTNAFDFHTLCSSFRGTICFLSFSSYAFSVLVSKAFYSIVWFVAFVFASINFQEANLKLGSILNSLFAFKKICFNSLFVCYLKQKQNDLCYFYFIVLTRFVCFICFFEKETKTFQTETQLSINARCPPRRTRSSPDRCDYAGRCIERLCSRLWRQLRKTYSTKGLTGYEGLDLLAR